MSDWLGMMFRISPAIPPGFTVIVPDPNPAPKTDMAKFKTWVDNREPKIKSFTIYRSDGTQHTMTPEEWQNYRKPEPQPDPTPEELLDWVKFEIDNFGDTWTRSSQDDPETLEELAQRIIDTVKRVSG